jgi:hypothetical protein
MLRTLKSCLWVGLLMAGVQASLGFALLGPINEPYQVAEIGYNLPGDIGAPKNLGEEYRRNTPVLYYTIDANFRDYFGSNGVAEIDAAFQIYNNLTNVSSYSPDLSEFPFTTQRRSGLGDALFLVDVKSATLWLITENMGLAEPERYLWTLHDRALIPGSLCPFGEVYLVIKRNFDPAFGTSLDQLKATSYVNGTLYSYAIVQACQGPNPLALAVPFPVDPTADIYSSVAGTFGNSTHITDIHGLFFTGLTRDDVGGLRYLLRAKNMNVENAGQNTLALITNNIPQLLVTSNLTLLSSQAYTNNAAALQALYPNLLILSTSNYFTNVFLTNFIPYFTNFPWDPVGSAAHLFFATNVTPTVETLYQHSVGNVLTLTNNDGGLAFVPLTSIPAPPRRSYVTLETSSVAFSNSPWGSPGSGLIQTNVTDVTYLTNAFGGDYLILDSNLCDIAILNSQLTNVLTFTNPVALATNSLILTNSLGFTNAGTVFSFSENLIFYFTNHTFVILPVICDSNNVAIREGIENIKFIRRDYDSLLSRFFTPITNEYILNTVTNDTTLPQRIRRVVTLPDFLITAQDLSAPNGVYPPGASLDARNINFTTNNNGAYPGLAGPGLIETPTVFTFDKVGPAFFNGGLVNTNGFLDETTQIPIFTWGSFDGTTNAPVVYPNDVSVFDLENQVLIQVTPFFFPDAMENSYYSVDLQSQGSTANWSAPFTWALASGSPGLPPGLSITTGAGGVGIISGTPFQAGFFDFVIEVTDAQGRKVDRSYSIKVAAAP